MFIYHTFSYHPRQGVDRVATATLLFQKAHRCAHLTWVIPSEREVTYHEAVEVRTCTHTQFPGASLLSL